MTNQKQELAGSVNFLAHRGCELLPSLGVHHLLTSFTFEFSMKSCSQMK
jgi:hypothetical protein